MKTPLDKLSFHRIGRGNYAPLWNLLEVLFNHDEERLDEILDAGADINMAEDSGCTALHYAVDYGDLIAVQLLLQRDANKYARCKTGSTPFHHAIIFGKNSITQCFIQQRAKLFFAPTKGVHADSELMWKLLLSGRENGVIGLLKDGVTPIEADLYNDTMLTHAAALGYSSIVAELLSMGLDAHHVSRQQYCVFDVAAMNNHVECMELLYRAGVDINHAGQNGMTALMYAAFLNSVDAVNWLLSHNAETDKISSNGLNTYDWSIRGSFHKHGEVDVNRIFEEKGLKPRRYDFSKMIDEELAKMDN